MPVSRALENSARNFCIKYACKFDFVTFESRVEEFTFLRPNGGWIDVYKTVFDQMYKNTLEKVAEGELDNLDGEAMLDDFEYTIIRPYVKERQSAIKHKPYVGMDRITRLEYLDRITKEAPSNYVDLYFEKYKNGENFVGQIYRQAKSSLEANGEHREIYVKAAGCIQALEIVNKNRSFVWRVIHPLKNNAEKRNAVLMKMMLVDNVRGGEEFYNEIVSEAYETLDTYERVSANLAQSMVHAREELSRKQKMNDAIKDNRFLQTSLAGGLGALTRSESITINHP